MRSLSPSLLAAQQSSSLTPYVEVQASNRIAGIVRLDWRRFYTGNEDDYFHALTVPGDGSLIRVRVAPPAGGRTLFRQRVISPGPSSDFSSWTSFGPYNVVVTAAASQGAEVSIFWINSNLEIRRIVSTDYGASWGSLELIDYSPTTAINGIAAAYKPNGDLALFFADQSTLYVKKRLGGVWQPKTAWDKTTGDLSGAAAVYSGDWDLLVTGKDTAGNHKLWSSIFGDGGSITPGSWSALKEFASAPSDGSFEYAHAALAYPDVYRCFYVEKFSGTEAYSRPYFSNSVLDAAFANNLWHEPLPYDFSTQFGLAVAWYGDYCWLSCPSGVWRAALTAPAVDLSRDVISAIFDLNPEGGRLTVELSGEGAQSSPAGLAASGVMRGCQLDLSPGCITGSGNEVSPGLTFNLEAIEYPLAGSNAGVLLNAADGWQAVRIWRARHQFRWNRVSGDTCVRDILAFVLARSGLKLEVISQSAAASGFHPDFSINPGDSGSAVIDRLLSLIPDVLFVEGSKAFLVHPQANDASVYSYRAGHSILEGDYRNGMWEYNRVRVEGLDNGGLPVIADTFAWDEIDRTGERPLQINDRNISNADAARFRGESILRKIEIGSDAGSIFVTVNCGQQLWDVIDITDERTGLTAARRRVTGISLVYNTRKGEYRQRLQLGKV